MMSIVYPNETWPLASEIESLDGTTDDRTGLPYIAKGTGPTSVPSYEVQYNRRQQRQNRILVAWRQGMVVDEGNLQIGVYPISFMLGGVQRVFAGATGVAVPDDSNRVVYLDSATTLQLAQVWPDDVTTFLPLAVVETLNGRMSVEDQRTFAAFHVPSLQAALVQDRRVVTAHCANVGNNASDTKVFELDPLADLTLEGVQVYCTATAATASVEVKEAGVSVLSAPATPSAGSVVKPTVSDGSIAAANKVSVHVTTNGTGSIANLTVTLLFKAPLAG